MYESVYATNVERKDKNTLPHRKLTKMLLFPGEQHYEARSVGQHLGW